MGTKVKHANYDSNYVKEVRKLFPTERLRDRKS